jgi:ribosomal 50S subunit-recycling heat shock protein
MRLDLFLKASRLCGRRTLAQKLCDAGRVSINGKSAKSSHAVKAGDKILLNYHGKLTTVRVLSVPTARQTSRQGASTLYEVMKEESLDEEGVDHQPSLITRRRLDIGMLDVGK